MSRRLKDLAGAESELLGRALIRHGLLLGSDNDRVAWRACKELYDRLFGPPRPLQNGDAIAAMTGRLPVAAARTKLAILIERRAREITENRVAGSDRLYSSPDSPARSSIASSASRASASSTRDG